MKNEQMILLNIRLVNEPRKAQKPTEKAPKDKALRVLPMHKGKLLSIVALIALATGCSSGGYVGSYDLVILGNEKGLEKLADHNIGLVNEGKTKEGSQSYHYQLREKQVGMEGLKAKLEKMKNHGK